MTWVIVLGVIVAGGAYMLYRRSKANAAAAQSAATPADASGTDTSGQVSTLQTEIMDLQSSEAQEDTTTGGGTIPRCPGGAHWDPVQGKCVFGTGEGPVPSGTGGGTKAGTPQRVRAGTVTASSAQILWDRAPGATGYDVRIAGRGTAASAGKNYVTTRRVAGLSTTFTGLRADTPYAVDVQALPGGGTGTIRVTTRKAARRPPGPRPRTAAAHTSQAA